MLKRLKEALVRLADAVNDADYRRGLKAAERRTESAQSDAFRAGLYMRR